MFNNNNLPIPKRCLDTYTSQGYTHTESYDHIIEVILDEAWQPTKKGIFDKVQLDTFISSWGNAGGDIWHGDRGTMTDDTYKTLINNLFQIVKWDIVATI